MDFYKPESPTLADISFVQVVDAGPGWTKVLASDGNTYTLDGDRNWRNNNPGNLEYGPFARAMGAIGSDGRFAVFPSYADGLRAQATLQFESPRYKDLSVKDAISRYAPAFENNVSAYVNAVTGGAGVTADTKLSELTPQQRAAFLSAQQRHEGFRPGKIKGEAGKPVPASVSRQFGGVPLPPMDIGLGGGQPTARDNIATQRAEQSEMRNRIIPPIPEQRPFMVGGRELVAPDVPPPRPDTVRGNVVKPLPAPAPLRPDDPLGGGRIGNFGTVTQYGRGAGKAVSGEVTYTPPESERSPALAAALARLGATVAAKAGVTAGKEKAQADVSGKAGAKAEASTRIDLNSKPGNVQTASAPYQEPIPHNVTPSIVPTLMETVKKQTPKAAPIVPQGPQRRASAEPKYITKTRQVLVEDEPKSDPKAAGKVAAGLLPGMPPSVIGGGTAMLGAKGVASGALTYTPPKKPVYRTEEYQVLNPLYVEPKGPTPEQIEAVKQRYAQMQAEEEARRKAEEEAARKAAAQKITAVGGGGAYLTTPFQEDRFQTTTNALMPASTNNSRWTTGY